MTLTVASLCSGYESTGLGLALAGWDHRLAFVADPDPAAAKVLAHHHPDVPNLGDITRVAWGELGLTGEIELAHMGFPCTDVSTAGRQAGLTEDTVIPAGRMACGCQWADHRPDCQDDTAPATLGASVCTFNPVEDAVEIADALAWLNCRDRNDPTGPPPERVVEGTRSGVWGHCRRFIAEVRPPLVLIENVPGLLSTWANRSTHGPDLDPDGDMEPGPTDLGDPPDGSALRALGAVLGDLAELRFDAVWICVSAADVGAPHLRKRIFILAWDTQAEDRAREILGRVVGSGRGHAVRPDCVTLLPTPAARLGDSRGTPNPETAARRMDDEGRRNLDDAIALLPTPQARDVKGAETEEARAGRIGRGTAHAGHDLPTALSLLPTPTARDGDGRGEGSPDYWRRRRDELGRDNGIPLGAAINLLPTPTVADSRGSRNATSGRSEGAEFNSGTTLSDIAYADRWGDYAPAIARWEQVIGRPAPDPTEPGKNGQPRLSARFVEWLQGLPDGYVTAVPGISRNDALRLLGNSNPPQQYAAAVNQLAAIVAAVTAKEEAA